MLTNNAIYLEMVLSLGRKYQYDQLHATSVERLSVSLFEQLKELHRLGETELTLLRHGALLHDLGIFMSTKKHHKHSAYIVLNDQCLDGYPQKERLLLSLLVRNHRKDVKLNSPDLSRFSKHVLGKLVAILRIADALDYFHRGDTVIKEVQMQNSDCILTIEGVNLENFTEPLRKKTDYFREVFGLNPVFTSEDTSEPDIENQPAEYDSGITELYAEGTTQSEQPEEESEMLSLPLTQNQQP